MPGKADWQYFPTCRCWSTATPLPPIFSFPNHGGQGRSPYEGAVALDLERLRIADRLWDLSWVAGELKHAWAWRTGNAAAAEDAIGHFFAAYLAALPRDPEISRTAFST